MCGCVLTVPAVACPHVGRLCVVRVAVQDESAVVATKRSRTKVNTFSVRHRVASRPVPPAAAPVLLVP